MVKIQLFHKLDEISNDVIIGAIDVENLNIITTFKHRMNVNMIMIMLMVTNLMHTTQNSFPLSKAFQSSSHRHFRCGFDWKAISDTILMKLCYLYDNVNFIELENDELDSSSHMKHLNRVCRVSFSI